MPGPIVVLTAPGLRGKRDEVGISRADLAAMTGIAVDRLWQIEAGAASPQSEERLALMHALDAGFEELFTIAAASRSRAAPVISRC